MTSIEKIEAISKLMYVYEKTTEIIQKSASGDWYKEGVVEEGIRHLARGICSEMLNVLIARDGGEF